METVNELDIDGYRWEMTDLQARQDIADLRTSSDKKIEELNNNLNLLKNVIYEQKKVNLILYNEFDIKVDNVQNYLYLLGDILFGSLYLRFDDAHNPFLRQEAQRQWMDIAEVPEVKQSILFYNSIGYAEIEEGYAKGDVRRDNGKILIREKRQTVGNRENWYILFQHIASKVTLIK